MLERLASAAYLPFSVSAGVLLGLVVIEVGTALLGKPASAAVEELGGGDHGPALDHHGPDGDAFGSVLDWLNRGRVPILVLIMLLLAGFAVAGFVLQALANAILAPLPWPVAVVAAALLALPATRRLSQAIGWLMPRDETYVIDHERLIGLTGTVTLGPARAGLVAKARFLDSHGNTHFPRIEPLDPQESIAQDELVLAVELRGQNLAVVRVTK
jgi:hypothetical protein